MGFFINMMKYISIFIVFYTFTIISCEDDQVGIKGNYFIHTKTKKTLPDSIINQLENGDIILRRGDGPLSFHLSRATGEMYTHCGIIYKKGTKLGVIHTLGKDASAKNIDGVQTIPLENFVEQAVDSTLYICRPVFKDSIGTLIVNRAIYYLNNKIPFDHGFSLLSPEKFYCSELLYYVFKDVNDGVNIFNIRKKKRTYLLLFSTFFIEDNFEYIYKS